jgi:preprotein translocase SecE subunit
VFKFLKEVFVELKNTKWYLGKDLYNSTFQVVLISIVISLMLFGLDIIFQRILSLIL